ncbi:MULTISPECIES: hypothetical protein [Flammeovirga]|uniref:Beta-lactamase-inhibitor-like PepSY-like domain-containing protein n=1 Tax=Flammeovirga agarivorans TaxID=2726742 RepID=A0A7X8SIY1_9BACT|nr:MULTISPECIES: hypothetical protein [Flammeovirga]NLR90987.1 hypothetical protein [Flammeovirga agarivorans]
MKLKSSLAFGLFLFANVTFAQKAVLKVEQIGEEEIPVNLVEEIEEDYSDFYIDQITVMPSTLLQEDFKVVYKNKPVTGLFSNTYEIVLKTVDGTEKIYMNKDGDVLMVKKDLENVDLPQSITDKINKDYPDWTVLKTIEKVRTKLNKGTELYMVYITKGEDKNVIYFTKTGQYMDNKHTK